MIFNTTFQRISVMRCLNSLIIVCVVVAVSIDFYKIYTAPPIAFLPTSKLARIIFYFSFFTVLSNLSCAIGSYWVLKIPNYTHNRLIVLRITTVLCLIITSLVYNTMLRGIHPRPDFLSHLANELLHVMIPFSGLVSWLCFDPHPRLTIKVLCYAAIAPLIYVIYMFAAGSITGYYQYPIFNINQLGVVQPLITALVISVFFIGLSVIFYKIDQHLGINQQR